MDHKYHYYTLSDVIHMTVYLVCYSLACKVEVNQPISYTRALTAVYTTIGGVARLRLCFS